MRSSNTELFDAMAMLKQTIKSYRYDAIVRVLGEILKAFESDQIELHDFLLALSSAIQDRHGDAASQVVSYLEESADAAASFTIPSPKFRIGQRVAVGSIDGDTGEYRREEGVIFGFTFCSEDHARYGKRKWTYYIHFDVPRMLDDEADEEDMFAV